MHCTTWREVAARITDMTVRGAPAIGVAAAGGLALAAREAAVAPADDRAAFDAALTRPPPACWPRGPRPSTSRGRSARCAAVWQRCDAAPQDAALPLLARARADPRRRHRPLPAHRRARRAAVRAPATASSRTATPAPWPRPATAPRSASSAPATSATHGDISRARRRDAALAAGRASHRLGAAGRGHPLPRHQRQHGRPLHARAARSTAWWWAPTASPPTATRPTRSAPTRCRCWPRSTACRSTWRRRCRTVDLAIASGADIPIEERDPDEVTARSAGAASRRPAPRPPPGLRRHAGGQHHRHHHRGRRAAPALRPGAAPGLRSRG